MKTHPSELFFYHCAAQPVDKKALAYASSIADYVNQIDICKEDITETQWESILLKLDMHAKDLLNRAHPDYQEFIAGKDFDDAGWLEILVKYPYLVKAPIVIYHDKAILCNTPSDVLKFD
ncbi:ArsC/Spx/MgsR family protein [Algoriphagus sp. CAU 1675]|uniref:arsenate reductase family protein n=1 Tax=Algoriphagus sp. CAU 1675 TaxID=3032597 RepID=UPI0023DCBBED|nr:ArsC/Spx/MgsR family protein [Algoriphagus sp. CAU 1675]MDF2157735.1 glutaredoxin [Algoriphagus sp. CAU 1675]